MLIALVICLALFVLMAGMFLLARTRKDNLGPFFRFVSWFIIVAGFFIILHAIGTGMYRCVRYHRMCNKESMCCKFDRHEHWCGMHCCNWDRHFRGAEEFEKEEGMACKHDMEKMGGMHDMDKMTPEEKADNKVKMLTEKLKLTNEQSSKVHEIMLKCFQTCAQNMKEAGGDKEKCEKLCDKANQEKLDALKKVLTPEQFKNLPECCRK